MIAVLLAGCSGCPGRPAETSEAESSGTAETEAAAESTLPGTALPETESASESPSAEYCVREVPAPPFTVQDAPPYGGSNAGQDRPEAVPFVSVHEDRPFFDTAVLQEVLDNAGTRIVLSPLDGFGRAGTALMCAGPETLPKGERGPTGLFRPSGWHQQQYPGLVDSTPPYLMNRAHLLMWALSGLTSVNENLIAGTRFMNTEGMLETELTVLRYIEDSGHHVLYRVMPVYDGDDLLASGVLIEAQSVEDSDCIHCVYVYNVQPGVEIDYRTGENRLAIEGE